MNAADEVIEGDEVVRSFMLTRGRTRTTVDELPIETLVSANNEARARRSRLPVEQLRIIDLLSGSMSIAEVSAHLDIPLRAAVILTSEMAASGLLDTGTVSSGLDADFLLIIRNALQLV